MSNSKFLLIILIFCGLFFACFSSVLAQVVINEVLPNPSGDEKSGEWIELYNPGGYDINLMGYKLIDAKNNELEIGEATVAAHAFLVIANGSNFYLNNSGSETVSLYNLDNLVISTFSYSGSKEDKSWGRIPDGGEISSFYLDPTPQEPNKAPATPTPVAMVTPTPAPTTFATFTPSSSPTPKETATPTARPTPHSSEREDYETLITQQDVLASTTPEPEVKGESTRQSVPFLAYLFIVGGIILLGIAGYPFLRILYQKYNKKDEKDI